MKRECHKKTASAVPNLGYYSLVQIHVHFSQFFSLIDCLSHKYVNKTKSLQLQPFKLNL